MKHILSERSVYLGQIEFKLLIIPENQRFYLWIYIRQNTNSINNYNIKRKQTKQNLKILSGNWTILQESFQPLFKQAGIQWPVCNSYHISKSQPL